MNKINDLTKYIKNGKLEGFHLVKFENTDFVCKLCGNIFNIEQSYGKKSSWCIDCHKFDRKCKYLQNKNKIKKQVKKYDKKNSKNRLDRQKKYISNNRQKIKDMHKKWSDNNKSNLTKYRRKYYNKKYKIDKLYRLKQLIRHRIRVVLKSKKIDKIYNLDNYLGCTLPELIIHLESKFTEGMIWENQGKWHIDHIVPLSSAKTEKEIYKLNHYTNLQPLWAKDNLIKSNKINLEN